MSDSLLSASWYRVADLVPRLSPGAQVTRQASRGRIWHVLTDAASGRHVRLNPAAYAFVGRCDGQWTVQRIWDLLLDHAGDAAPTQDEIIRVLTQLYSAGVLQFDSAPNLAALFAQRDDDLRARRRGWINPLMIRTRLFDPTRVLDLAMPLVRGVPTWLLACGWIALVASGLMLAAMQFPGLQADAARLLGAPHAFLMFWLCFPPVKALHEMAHALAVRRFGGEVREAGVTLMFFTPAPYVDASAASALDSRGQRALVGAAGMLVELALAAFAALLWFSIEPGLPRDLCLVIMMICGVSTLVVNGNPLLRFDGYYILTDLLDLPNLALRSSAWWSQWLRRRLTGERAQEVVLGEGERKWLVAYAPASLLYRCALMLALLLFVGAKSSLLGGLLAFVLLGWAGSRAWAAWRGMLGAGLPEHARARTRLALGGSVTAAALLIAALPLPQVFIAQGIVWPPENAQVRAQTAGFIETVDAHNGQAVAPGAAIVSLADPNLVAQRERLQSELAGFESRQYFALLRDPVEAASLGQDIERTQAAIARTDQQLGQLEVTGTVAGRLVLPREADLPGSFAARGAMVGYVLTPGAAHVRAALPEADIPLIRGRVRSIEVRAADVPGMPAAAQWLRETPAATRMLPSAALGDRAGGPFAVDPADKDGTRTLDPVFLMDLAVPAWNGERIGHRVAVRLDLGYAPLGEQVLRRMRQLFLRHFNSGGQT